MSAYETITRLPAGGQDYVARIALRDIYPARTIQDGDASAVTWDGTAAFNSTFTNLALFSAEADIPLSNGYREMSIAFWDPTQLYRGWDPDRHDLRIWVRNLQFLDGANNVALMVGLLSGSPAANRVGGAMILNESTVGVCGPAGVGGSDSVTDLDAACIELATDGGDSLFTHLYARGSATSGQFKPLVTGGSGVTGFDRDAAKVVVGVGSFGAGTTGTEIFDAEVYFDILPKPDKV